MIYNDAKKNKPKRSKLKCVNCKKQIFVHQYSNFGLFCEKITH